MAEIAVSVAARVAEYLVGPIIRPLGYLFNYRRNITDLNQQIHSLDLERERLQIPVDEANRQGDGIFRGVQEWLTYAEGIIQNRDDFNEAEKKASKSCFYLRSRYRLSKQAKKQAGDIVLKIQEAHTFGGRVSYRPPPSPSPPPPFISAASFKDYEAFQSRTTTFNQIMEALRNEDISMIGVWGMGGVGKTTLVKHVAKQAEEENLFHKVVMALNISQTPNISEIQGKIASMLGLTLENNNQRAVHLWERLKKQEKILVILDDIWAKLGLREIGIPYGDDHKGCKLLLTSRDLRVLDTDMRTQKEFHVPHLNEEEAWSLFKRTAGDSVEKPELRPIAVNVVQKCEGLPIAIVTIAKALKNKSSVPVWQNALEELRRAAPTNIRGVTEGVYSCLELSYNHLEGEEVKSLFLLCGLLGDGYISMDHLLQYAMGLNLCKGIYSCEKAANKLITLVEILQASSLLLDDEDGCNDRYLNLVFGESLFFDEIMLLRMHDVVRDVARSIASKDPHQFVVKEAVGEEEEWQWMDECRNCTRISLKCKKIDELPQGLVCPKLEFFLLNSSNGRRYLKIPDAFFQDTKQLRVLDLSGVSLAPSPSSLGLLSNLRTLCLKGCVLGDIAVIGDLKRLQVLSLAWSGIEQLPKEMMQLSDLRVLDLRNCYDLKVIPRNVISSLSRLEYLSMEGCSKFEWEKEGFDSGERINNACVSELKHLSGLRTLEVKVSDPRLLPEDDVVFDNLNLTRYSIAIGAGDYWITDDDEYEASRWLIMDGVKSLHILKYFSKLLKRSQFVHLSCNDTEDVVSQLVHLSCNDTEDVLYELDEDGFPSVKYLRVDCCRSIQYILHSTSAEWIPPCDIFCMLEKLNLMDLNNLEAVCHGPIPMGSFGNLRRIMLWYCERLKYVFSLPTQHDGRELVFPRLQELNLGFLPEVISFYSIRSNGSEESVTLFNEQVAFPALEFLDVDHLDNVRALWHNQLSVDSFSKLKKLTLHSCDKLLNVFPLFVVKALVQLEDLFIHSCGALKVIVANENEDQDEATPLFLFPKLTFLTLSTLPQLKRFCSGKFTSRWPLLKKLKVCNCDEVEILFQEMGLEGELGNRIEQPLFLIKKEAFPDLEELSLTLKGTVEIWRVQFSRVSFSKLRVLDITGSLINLLTLSMAKRLVQLKTLIIRECNMLEEIMGNEGDEPTNGEIDFTELKSLVLHFLPNLKSFCSARYTIRFPSLEKMSVTECHKMEFFCKGVLDTPRLKHVRMTNWFSTEECWEGNLNTTIHKKFMEQLTFSVDATTQLRLRSRSVRTRGGGAHRRWERWHRSIVKDAPLTNINPQPMEETISPPLHQQPISSISPPLQDQTPFSVVATTQLQPQSEGVRTIGRGAHRRWKRQYRSILRNVSLTDISPPPIEKTPTMPMKVPSTLLMVPLVKSSPQPLEAILVDKEVVPTAYHGHPQRKRKALL